MFTKAQQQAGGSQAPAVFWSGTNTGGPSLGATCGLAVAPNGFIWCADFDETPGHIVRAWAPTHPTGNPAPDIVLTCATFSGPYSLAFDAEGNLWVMNGVDSKLQRIPAASLLVTGTVVADVIIDTPGNILGSKITFPNNPDRVGLLPSGAPPSQ
jgi:sugar lactone lactonase YvrE